MQWKYSAIVVLVLSIFALGQNFASPVSARGAGAELLQWDTKANTAVVRVTNTSAQDITGFVLAVTAVHANGKMDRDERMTDLVLTMIPKQAIGQKSPVRDQLLHPGENREETVSLTATPENPIIHVDVRVEVVTYVDETAEVANEDAFGRLLAERRGNLLARQRTLEIINKTLSNPAAMHPIADAIAHLQALHVRPSTQQDVSLNGELASVIRDLQNIAERSIEHDSNGSRSLRDYAATKQKEWALLSAHTELRRQP